MLDSGERGMRSAELSSGDAQGTQFSRELPLHLAVRASNLLYDIDHWSPRSRYEEMSNKAMNLGFLPADENRRKGAREFTHLPEQRPPISLRAELAKGADFADRAAAEMLGSCRFSEIVELNALWQIASRGETAPYDEAQKSFRRLIADSPTSEANAVRATLARAGIEVVRAGGSYQFRMDETPYHRSPGLTQKGLRRLWALKRGRSR
jgi:hypothetical protein